MAYKDYVNLKFKPDKKGLICTYYIEPLHLSLQETAGGVAAESSTGTWIDVKTKQNYVKKLDATVFSIKKQQQGAEIKIYYPSGLFEKGNMPNILSSIAGNIFGMEEIKNIKLLDISFPNEIARSFAGPKYGIQGIRKIMKVHNRPLLGTIIKPKLGLKTGHHAKVAYESWLGGCDVVKDDENLSSQKFNRFEDRLKETLKMKERAEKETGSKKAYLVNVTAETKEMLRRAKLAENYGNEYIMIDVLTAGFSALQTLRQENFDLIIHAHRAGHAAMTKNHKHGIGMNVLVKMLRLVGVDQLHVGAAVGKMFETSAEVKENILAAKEKTFNLKPVMPVASGGLAIKDIPAVVKIFGKDVVIQMGGGIHSHPQGTFAGAREAREAIENAV
ncbi:type III ribulose-bisphosphate carboxylase [Candidatus Pacearchaeota archaeon]|nr:type III ribulose-bisphosphate carboxylase [Candidatus Pacearchaeota archaeon]